MCPRIHDTEHLIVLLQLPDPALRRSEDPELGNQESRPSRQCGVFRTSRAPGDKVRDLPWAFSPGKGGDSAGRAAST